MEILQTLGLALGLATMAGVNLYLTVLVAGLAIRFGWVALSSEYEALAILQDPAILTVAGILFLVEFFTDKVPWVDTLWDGIHTIIRPVGGALLAIQVLGTANPVFDVILALLAGSVTLTAHTVKAGTRMVVNASPEPFSNIAVSVTEDVGVVGGVIIALTNPMLMLGIILVGGAIALYLMPKVFRVVRVKASLVYHKINARSREEEELRSLPRKLPPDLDILFASSVPSGTRIRWAIPSITRRVPGVRSNLFGYLVMTEDAPHVLHFVSAALPQGVHALDTHGLKACHEEKFLGDYLTLYSLENGNRSQFLFNRTQAPFAALAAADLESRLGGIPQAELEEEEAHVS
ncbi:MAG: DUF4126 domain-containing protein [Verrucomicrobiales bacterium]